MNLQEDIKRILQEETSFIKTILRRVHPNLLEKEFSSSLRYISSLFIKNYKSNPKNLTEYEFMRMVAIDLIQILNLRNILPKDIEWYDKALNSLIDYYKERMSSMYNVLKK